MTLDTSDYPNLCTLQVLAGERWADTDSFATYGHALAALNRVCATGLRARLTYCGYTRQQWDWAPPTDFTACMA